MLGFVPCLRTSGELRGTEFGVCSSETALFAQLRLVMLCNHERREGLQRAELGSAVRWKGRNPMQLLKLRLSFQTLTAGIYFVCKTSKFAAEITGTQSPEPHVA